MAFILTFLGKGGVGKTTVALAAANHLANQGKRVLFATQDTSPALAMLLGQPVGSNPTTVGLGFDVVQLRSTVLLERAWEKLKTLESQYLRTPFFKSVYGEELGILPGMDNALALNAILQWEGQYDTIVYDSPSSPEVLRMLGMPEVVSWYMRRFRQVFVDSDLGKTLSPFIPPVAAAVLNFNFMGDNFSKPTTDVTGLLDKGINILSDPNQTIAYLVTTSDPVAQATAQYLWGSAQQVGLCVAGVIANPTSDGTPGAIEGFGDLPITQLPYANLGINPGSVLSATLPDFSQRGRAPRSVVVDKPGRKVSLYLPSFDKTQVKLTQYGPEITIEAGDQRRNVFLPVELSGLPVAGAKFQDGYLIISF